jgi:putative membrane protein (TIGR04086 family)
MNKRILRSIISVFVGLLVAIGIVFIAENIIGKVYPVEQKIALLHEKQATNIELSTEESYELKKYIKHGDGFMVLLCMIVGYVFASMIGGGVAGKIARTNGILKGLLVGLIFAILCVLNAKRMDHPEWFFWASVIAPLPCAIIGSSFAVYWAKEDEAAEPEVIKEEEEPLFSIGDDDEEKNEN